MDFLNQETIQNIQEFALKEGVDWTLNILAALTIFVLGRWLGRRFVAVVEKGMVKGKMDTTLAAFLANILNILVLAFVIIASLSKLGVETTSIAAIFAAAGLAVGLALQSSLSNLAAGVMIIMFRPFKVGEFIEAGGESGSVEEVHIFTTVMRSPDNKKIIVPNGEIISNSITNYSANPTRRIDLVFCVGYDEDIRKVKDVLLEVVNAEARVLKDPEVVIAVDELADSSVNFVVRPWVKTSDYLAVSFALKEQVKIRFDQEGISIPYPQRDVRVHQMSLHAVAEAA